MTKPDKKFFPFVFERNDGENDVEYFDINSPDFLDKMNDHKYWWSDGERCLALPLNVYISYLIKDKDLSNPKNIDKIHYQLNWILSLVKAEAELLKGEQS